MWKRARRWLFGLALAGIGTLIALTIAVYVLADTKVIAEHVKNLVASETGGRLDGGDLNFNPWSGFTWHHVTFTPPKLDGTPANSGDTGDLLQIDSLRLAYNPLALLYGTLQITKAITVGGKLIVNRSITGASFQGITHVQKTKKSTNTVDTIHTDPNESLASKLSFISQSLSLPIRIKIEELGFENLTVDYKNGSTKLTLKNLSTKINVSAFHSKISLGLKTLVDSVHLNQHTLGPFKAEISTKINLRPKDGGLDIEDLTINILDKLRSSTTASLTPTAGSPTVLSYTGKSSTTIDTSLLETFRSLVSEPVKAAGTILINLDGISGVYPTKDPASVKHPEDFEKLLPTTVTLGIKGHNLALDLPARKLSLVGAQFQYNFSQNRQLNQNSKLSSEINLVIKELKQELNVNKEIVKATIENLSLKKDTRLHAPNPITSQTKLSLHANELRIEGNRIGAFTAPVSFEINSDFTGLGNHIFLDEKLQLGELLSQSLIVKCEYNCKTFETEGDIAIPNLAKLWSKSKPLVMSFLDQQKIPETITGNIVIKSKARGYRNSKQLKASNQSLLSNLKTTYEITTKLKNISLSTFENRFSVNQIDGTLEINGNQDKLTTNVDLNTRELHHLDEKTSEQKETISIQGLKLMTSISADGLDLQNLSALGTKGHVAVKTSASAEKTLLTKTLDQPLKNIGAHLDLDIQNLKKFYLNKFIIGIPDLSTSVQGAGEVSLQQAGTTPEFSIRAKTATKDIPASLFKGITGTGEISTDIAIETIPQDKIKIHALIALDRFSAILANEKNPQRSIEIKEATGTFPIQQIIAASLLGGSQLKTPKLSEKDPVVVQKTRNTLDLSTEVDQGAITSSAADYLQRIRPRLSGDTRMAMNQDFSSFRQFYAERRPFTIKEVKTANLSLENIEIDAEVVQNQVNISNAIAHFLGGKIHLETKLSFDDKPQRINTTLHVTNLNTEKLVKSVPGLKRKATNILTSKNPLVDGAVHINYDLREKDLRGSISITSIGKDQLRMILYYIDPTDRDSTISSIKTALNFGDIKLVSIPIKNGEIGLDVRVRLLVTPIPTPTLQGFPIAKLLENFQAQGEKEPNETKTH